MKIRFNIIVLAALFATACNNNGDNPDKDKGNEEFHIPSPLLVNYQVLNQFPHDTLSFTEGFTFFKGNLFESTGAPDEPASNNTWAGILDLKTGKYDKKVDLGKAYFGEGITFLNGKMYQLTYKAGVGFIYDDQTFKKLGSFNYKGEGWGFTNDGKNLIMSNGTSNLYYLDPDSLRFLNMLPVQDNNGYVSSINELEYIDGYIYANQWLTPNILKIDPRTGYVVARLDMSRISNDIKAKYPNAEEMNGIAYDSSSKKTYITGKKWPFIYQIGW
jgi:glutamine cyclotransferase